ncbi:MAG: Alpha/beta fold hydrolase [Actinomycetota bacterium]|nr:Alpha/beta fold hydrolase [Actinomycetota bacterium]
MRTSRPAAGLVALAVCLTAAAPLHAAPSGPGSSGPGSSAGRQVVAPRHRTVASLSPGTPVRVVPLSEGLRLAGAGPAWLMHYISTAKDGHRMIVTGTLTLPEGGAPAEGWPVVSFGHGLSGLADACAPSSTGPSPWERIVQETLLGSGFAIAVTDYQGVGGPGPGVVGEGVTDARAMADIVRAARRTAPVSRTWEALGYSLGGQAALFAGSFVHSYAPELRHVGSIAMAPPTHWGQWLSALGAADPSTIPVPAAVIYLSDLLERKYPGGYRAEDWLTPEGLAFEDRAQNMCIDALTEELTGITFQKIAKDPAAFAQKLSGMTTDMEIPVNRYPRPVHIVHGNDDVLPVALSRLTAEQLAAAGTEVTFTPVPGADHLTLLPRIAPQVLNWTQALFARA